MVAWLAKVSTLRSSSPREAHQRDAWSRATCSAWYGSMSCCSALCPAATTMDDPGASEPAQDAAPAAASDSHDTLKYHLLGPSLTKAGQDAVDQRKVSGARSASSPRERLNEAGFRDHLQRIQRV